MTPDKTPSEAELLPCPFCGEAAKHSFNSLYGDMSMASCKSCGATAYAPKWNRRAVLAKWGQPAQAQAQADSVQEDAARYRWLRDTSNADDPSHMIALHIRDEQNDASLSGIDAAIDAARKQGATP